MAAALRKAQLWEMFHDHSRSSSHSTISSDLSSNSSNENLVFASNNLESHHVPSTMIPSFSRDSYKTVQQKKSNLTVNGHPIPDRLVKKAEKVAGPIQPWDYWYDFRAGFWGVMGGRALGIIPPFIQEFNYPMPAHCSGGNTGIFVNGRELHQRDLDLLHGRGLPTDRGKSYTIEMSGRVLDEQTGEELHLGKLAPTVEKVKHGFGMKVPRFYEV